MNEITSHCQCMHAMAKLARHTATLSCGLAMHGSNKPSSAVSRQHHHLHVVLFGRLELVRATVTERLFVVAAPLRKCRRSTCGGCGGRFHASIVKPHPLLVGYSSFLFCCLVVRGGENSPPSECDLLRQTCQRSLA